MKGFSITGDELVTRRLNQLMKEFSKKYKDGEISQEEYMEELDKLTTTKLLLVEIWKGLKPLFSYSSKWTIFDDGTTDTNCIKSFTNNADLKVATMNEFDDQVVSLACIPERNTIELGIGRHSAIQVSVYHDQIDVHIKDQECKGIALFNVIENVFRNALREADAIDKLIHRLVGELLDEQTDSEEEIDDDWEEYYSSDEED